MVTIYLVEKKVRRLILFEEFSIFMTIERAKEEMLVKAYYSAHIFLAIVSSYSRSQNKREIDSTDKSTFLYIWHLFI